MLIVCSIRFVAEIDLFVCSIRCVASIDLFGLGSLNVLLMVIVRSIRFAAAIDNFLTCFIRDNLVECRWSAA